MQFTWSHSLRLSLCAAAVCALGAVNAQTAPPASPAAAPTPAAQAAPPQAHPHEGKKPHHMQRHHKPHKGERHHDHHGKYATPEAREAAAARAEERSGRHHRGEGLDQYERNALARCDVFREAEDRRSCVERVRTAPVSGSVKEGGVLREYSEQVPVRP